jgi:DNA-binding CsgD family transcriptional regulator
MRPLDKNELEALTLFANGNTADEIASALGVSQSMANHYLRMVARKLGARNRVHAVAIAETQDAAAELHNSGWRV